MSVPLLITLAAAPPSGAELHGTELPGPTATLDAHESAASAGLDVSGATWLDAHHAELLETWRSDPEQAAAVWQLDASETRVGSLRFGSELIEAEGVGPVFLERLVHGDENSATRLALVDLVWRLDCQWQPAVSALYATETDAGVRAALVHIVRKGDDSYAAPIVEAGLSDSDAEVRATALRSMRYLDDSSAWADQVVAAMADGDSFVRMEAARTAGRMELETAWTPLVAMLGDAKPEVRLRALRALEDISPSRVARQPEVQALHSDTDFKVARAARQVAPE